MFLVSLPSFLLYMRFNHSEKRERELHYRDPSSKDYISSHQFKRRKEWLAAQVACRKSQEGHNVYFSCAILQSSLSSMGPRVWGAKQA